MLLAPSLSTREIDDPLNDHMDRLRHLLSNDNATKVAPDKHQHDLQCALHSAVFQFEDDPRYRNDPRYVRCWLLYASFLRDPTWAYQWMQHKRIGEYVAAFYEQAADNYAKHQCWDAAETLLSQGIRREAQPTARLESASRRITRMRSCPVPSTKNSSQFQRLMDAFDWVQIQLGHERRTAMFRECYRFQPEEISFEELRANSIAYRGCKRLRRDYEHVTQEVSRIMGKKCKENVIDDSAKNVKFDCGVDPVSEKVADKEPEIELPQGQGEITEKDVAPPETHSAPPTNPPSPERGRHSQYRPDLLSVFAEAPDELDYDPIFPIPLDPAFISRTLTSLSPSLSAYPGYQNLTFKVSKQRARLQRITTTFSGNVSIILGDKEYQIRRMLGEGGMAKVYQVKSDGGQYYALKVQSPPNPWEFYILRQLQTRTAEAAYIIKTYEFYHYQDASFMLLDLSRQGTLLDAMNAQRIHLQQAQMPEPLAMLFIIRLLQAVIAMHEAGIIHGDIKIENIMLDFRETQALPAHYNAADKQWINQRLKLIDFGRAVDLSCLPVNPMLKAAWPPQPADPVTVQQRIAWKPWVIDYWGVASVAHWLLFGESMAILKLKTQVSLRKPLKRYWQRQMWQKLFDLMLNPPTVQPTHELKRLVRDFQDALAAEGMKAKSPLKLSILRLERAIAQKLSAR